jgi:hypothetical protein
MPLVFKHHFTRDEASALLPRIRVWLKRLVTLRREIGNCDEIISKTISSGGDAGGSPVNRMITALAGFNDVFGEFREREIQVKDLDRGLIDFPAIIDEKEVFLCWELDEEDVTHWHDLDAGYSGREKL